MLLLILAATESKEKRRAQAIGHPSKVGISKTTFYRSKYWPHGKKLELMPELAFCLKWCWNAIAFGVLRHYSAILKRRKRMSIKVVDEHQKRINKWAVNLIQLFWQRSECLDASAYSQIRSNRDRICPLTMNAYVVFYVLRRRKMFLLLSANVFAFQCLVCWLLIKVLCKDRKKNGRNLTYNQLCKYCKYGKIE